MKKLLVSALALAMLVPYSPAAHADELLKNLTFNGSIDMQATSANNISDFNTNKYDQIGDAQTRIMLNGNWDILDDVHAKVGIFENDGVYGTGGGTSYGVGTNEALIAGGGAGVLNETYVDQASFKVDKVFGAVDTTLGRQFYGDAGDAIIYFGPTVSPTYGMGVSAIDAARFDWANDMVGVTGIVGKAKGATLGAGDESGDTDVRGLTATLKSLPNASAGAYVYNAVVHNSAVGSGLAPAANQIADTDLWVLGLKGKAEMAGAWLKGEFAKDFGDMSGIANNNGQAVGTALTVPAGTSPRGNFTGWALLADLGYKADLAPAAVIPWIKLGIGSGGATTNRNFTAISPDYQPGGIYGRFAGVGGNPLQLGSGMTPGATFDNGSLSDLVNWGIGVKTTPTALPKLTAGLAYWDYRFESVSSISHTAGASGNTHIGSELDLDLAWAHSDNVTFDAGIGQFWTGGYINNVNGASHVASDGANLAYVDVHVKF